MLILKLHNAAKIFVDFDYTAAELASARHDVRPGTDAERCLAKVDRDELNR